MSPALALLWLVVACAAPAPSHQLSLIGGGHRSRGHQAWVSTGRSRDGDAGTHTHTWLLSPSPWVTAVIHGGSHQAWVSTGRSRDQ